MAIGVAIGIVVAILLFLNLSLDVTRYMMGTMLTFVIAAVLAVIGLLIYSSRLRRQMDIQPTQFSELVADYLALRQQGIAQSTEQQQDFQTKLKQVGRYVVSIVATIRAFGFLFGAATVAVSAAMLVATLMQVDRLDLQNQLSEASRRAALINKLTAILSEIDEELDASAASNERMAEIRNPRPGISPTYVDEGSELTKRLVWRIIALSRSLRPYRFLEDDALSATTYSPERGQLLVSLVASGIRTTEVFRMGSFDASYLREAELANVYMHDIKLTGASLREANLITSNLSACICRTVDFEGAILFSVDMTEADVTGSRFGGARLPHSNYWQGAKMGSIDLEGAYVGESTWITDLQALENPPENFNANLWIVSTNSEPWFLNDGEAGLAYRISRAAP